MNNYDHEMLYRSMVDNDDAISKCLGMISSNKKRVAATSIFMMINVDRRAMEATVGKSGIWSIPKGRRDSLTAIDPSMSSETAYAAKASNWMRIIKNLKDENVIHEFGFRDMTAYCMEPFPLSWRCCNSSTVCLYPGSLIRMIDHMESLFVSFLTNSGDRHITAQMLMRKFAEFVAEKRETLSPSIQKKVPKLIGDDYEAYIYQVKNVLLGMDILEGKQYVKFKLDVLPDSVYSLGVGVDSNEFASLIPRDSRVCREDRGVRNSLPAGRSLAMRMESADGIPNIDLDITTDPIHLLQLMERDIRMNLHMSSDVRVFSEYGLELAASKNLMDLLDNVCARNYDSLRQWVSWYAKNHYSDDSRIASGIEDLCKTWNKFTESNFTFQPDYEPQSDIVGHLDRVFHSADRRVAVCESCMTYGFGITYSYAKIKFGRSSAEKCLSSTVGELEKIQSHDIATARRRMSMMIMATVRHYYRFEQLDDEMPHLIARMQCLKNNLGIVIDQSDYNNEETAPVRMFWKFADSHHV